MELPYGSRAEIVDAVRGLARDAADGRLDPDTISEEALSGRMLSRDLPDPDLLIRTSGGFLYGELETAESRS